MERKSVVNVVGVTCLPQFEEKFNKWYEQTHIPMLLKFKGVKKVTRYKILKPVGGYPEYLTILEFDNEQSFIAYETSPELAAATAESQDTWKEKGWDRMWRLQYQVLKTWSE